MTSSIEVENNAYKPETKLRTRRMTSTGATTSANGAVEAIYFFKTFPGLRPVGPFNDPRNSIVMRFRLEGSDKTGVSYVVGRNITSEAVDQIKREYNEMLSERRSKKNKQETNRTTIPKKYKANIKSPHSAKGDASSQESAATEVQPPINATATSVHDGNKSLVGIPLALFSHTYIPESQQVTEIDLMVDKWIADHRLTQDQKNLFLQHVTTFVNEWRRNGITTFSEMAYLKYCKFLLDRIYPIDQKKEDADSFQTELSAWKKNRKY